MKRALDIIISLLSLVFLSPLFLLIVLSICLFDGCPVLFQQMRVGIHGSYFRLHKFRTMHSLQKSYAGTFDAGDTSRITKIGSVLRKAKLDELPQLWNVFIGDMSLVGPRPEVQKWVNAYPARWAKVLTVKPGITDPASIYYRNEEELLAKSDDPDGYYRKTILPHKLDLYEDYVDNQTFVGDILIIVKTIHIVFFPKHYSDS